MSKEQYWEMIRLSLIANGTYGITKHPSENERNKMYEKYMKLRGMYHKCKGIVDER